MQLHFTGKLNIRNNHPPIDVSEKMSAEEKISLRKMILRMEMLTETLLPRRSSNLRMEGRNVLFS